MYLLRSGWVLWSAGKLDRFVYEQHAINAQTTVEWGVRCKGENCLCVTTLTDGSDGWCWCCNFKSCRALSTGRRLNWMHVAYCCSLLLGTVFLLRMEIYITAEDGRVGQFMPHMLYILYCSGFELEEVGMPSPGVLLFYFLFDIGVLQNAIFKTHFHFLSESTLFILLWMRTRFKWMMVEKLFWKAAVMVHVSFYKATLFHSTGINSLTVVTTKHLWSVSLPCLSIVGGGVCDELPCIGNRGALFE